MFRKGVPNSWVGDWRGGFSFKLYLLWTVKRPQASTWTVDFPSNFYGAGWGGFVFLSANGKAQGALLLFLLSLGCEKDFLNIFLCFPMCSHSVPSKFLMGSRYVLHISISLLFHMLSQMLFSFHLYRRAQGEELYTSKQNLLFWGASIVSFFKFLGSNGPIKLACRPPKKKKRTWIVLCVFTNTSPNHLTVVNQHPPLHHPLDTHYDSVVDEPQLG